MKRILFQFDRASGVRGSLFEDGGTYSFLAVSEHADTMRAREKAVSREYAAKVVAEARKRNGDGDTTIIVDEWADRQ